MVPKPWSALPEPPGGGCAAQKRGYNRVTVNRLNTIKPQLTLDCIQTLLVNQYSNAPNSSLMVIS